MRLETTDNPLYDLHVAIEEMEERANQDDFSFQEDLSVQTQLAEMLESLDEILTGDLQEHTVYEKVAERVIGGHGTVFTLAGGEARVSVDDEGAVTIDYAKSPETVLAAWRDLTEEVEFEGGDEEDEAREEDYERYENPHAVSNNIEFAFPNRWLVSLLTADEGGHLEVQARDPEGNTWNRAEVIALFPEALPDLLAAVRDTPERVWSPAFANQLHSLANK